MTMIDNGSEVNGPTAREEIRGLEIHQFALFFFQESPFDHYASVPRVRYASIFFEKVDMLRLDQWSKLMK